MGKLAERLGANKDLFQVNILAGIPAGSTSLTKKGVSTKQHYRAAAVVQYVVSEVAFYPTISFEDTDIYEEGARLWLAGYKMGNYRKVKNREVPAAFKKMGILSEKSAKKIMMKRIMAQSTSSVLFQSSI